MNRNNINELNDLWKVFQCIEVVLWEYVKNQEGMCCKIKYHCIRNYKDKTM